MADTITHNSAKGIGNRTDTTNRHYFFRSNFNMPVKDIDSSWASWLRYNGPYFYYDTATSFNVSGLLPGHEIFCNTAVFDWNNPNATTRNLDAYLYHRFLDTDGLSLIYSAMSGYHFVTTITPYSWRELTSTFNQGVADWEIDQNSTYYASAWATGTDSISITTNNISFTNVPSTSHLSSGTEGHMWIEGNNLCYVSADAWKHPMVGIQVSTSPGTSKAGYMWLDGTDLHWVGANGYDYKAAWKVKQFASSFSNGPTGSTFAGTANYGKIWVDDEFGWNHIAYIANDGYKYLTGSGDDPYV